MDRSSLVATSTSNTPTVQTGATVLAANNQRAAFVIQNQSTSPLWLNFGGTASSTVYHLILKGCTGAADGSGGVASMEGPVVFTGIITAYSTGSLSYTVLEI